MKPINFNPRFSLIILTTFILFTVVGTLTHELGHIAVAKFLGYETKLSYGFMNYFHEGYLEDKHVIEAYDIADEYYAEISNEAPFPKKKRLEELQDIIKEKYPTNKPHSLYITLGGPIQTLLTACIGLLILFYRRSWKKAAFTSIDWLGVFLSLFVLREVFNFVNAVYSAWFFNRSNFHADEFRISRYLGYNEWVIPTITMFLGAIVSLWVIFKVIPKAYRFSFIFSGLIGGLLGFAIWFGFLGKMILP